MRLFVAVNLADALRAPLAAAQRQLAATGADVKWTDPAGFHLTLKFLGEVDEARLPQIEQAVAAAVAGQGPFDLHLRGMGGFPTARSPRVVWVAVTEGRFVLARLAGRLEEAFEPLGFEREKRPYSPHLTLGRVRTPRGRDPLAAKLTELADADFGGMPVHAVHLMESRLSPRGASYRPAAQFELPSH